MILIEISNKCPNSIQIFYYLEKLLIGKCGIFVVIHEKSRHKNTFDGALSSAIVFVNTVICVSS